MNLIEGEARTRIIWGEKPADVEEFLSQNGYTNERAKSLVNILLSERYKIVRSRGVKRVLVGVTLVVICAWSLVAMFSTEDAATAFSESTPDVGIGCMALGFFWGIWKSMDGLRDLLRPEAAGGDLGFHGEQV